MIQKDDTISRKWLIECLEEGWINFDTIKDTYKYIHLINVAPSAQPEIIRCKECKHRDPEDKKCDSGHFILWQLPRDDDWFCADAERRTNETD